MPLQTYCMSWPPAQTEVLEAFLCCVQRRESQHKGRAPCGAHLAGAVDAHGAHGQALHVLLAAPEADVVLEGQQVEHAVQDAHQRGQAQEVGIALQQHALQLVALAFALRAHRALRARHPGTAACSGSPGGALPGVSPACRPLPTAPTCCFASTAADLQQVHTMLRAEEHCRIQQKEVPGKVKGQQQGGGRLPASRSSSRPAGRW